MTELVDLTPDYHVFFVHSNDDHKSLNLVIEQVNKKHEGFGALYSSDRSTHNVVLCSESYADAFDEVNHNEFDGAFWLTKYELHPKRLPLPDSEKTLKVNVPHDLTSLQAKLQLRSMLNEISKFIPLAVDKVNIRVPLKDGSHRGFCFMQFDADDNIIALVKMFLPSFSFKDTKKQIIKCFWYHKRATQEAKKESK